MPRGLNKVLLIGNLGRDPEMRYTPDGTPVTTFSIASSRMWVTSNGDRREVTEWFNIVAWRRLAEICSQQLTRGSRIYIEGRLQTRSWDDAEGRHHQRVEVVANEMIILDGASRLGSGTYDSGQGTSDQPSTHQSSHNIAHATGIGQTPESNDVVSSGDEPERAQFTEE